MKKIKDWFLKRSLIVKVIIILLFLGVAWIIISSIFGKKKTSTQYQTSKAQKDTLIVTVTGSGQVSTANNGTISTLATGVVSKIYVKDGDEVKTGDKIAEIDLDLSGQQNAAQALSSYQSAKNGLESAKTALYTLQSDMFTQWDKEFKLSTNTTYQNSDGSPNYVNRALPEFHIAEDNWLASEAKFKNQQNVVSQAQSSLNSAWLSYQKSSPTVYAPISGIISGFSMQIGSVIVENTNTSNSAQSATKIANIKTKALPMVSINLTEIDVPKVKLGDKATVTFDALTDKTFTGKVISIDTAGSVSSNVATYPTVIRLDSESESILPNMAASANIITDVKNNALLVPIAAVKKQTDGTSYVEIMKNNLPTQITVETGLSSTTEIEIVSGLSEGDAVITNAASSTSGSQQKSTQTTSVFGGGIGGNRMGR
jgi:multidrug efflux pump subunit AcrA (membrane-fusion protein)